MDCPSDWRWSSEKQTKNASGNPTLSDYLIYKIKNELKKYKEAGKRLKSIIYNALCGA